MNHCPLCEAVRRCREGADPSHVASFEHCEVMLGENQGCRGWCVLVLKRHIEHMAELTAADQMSIFGEVARVAAAIRAVFGPVRINYECLGNLVPHVHWHVIPRHADDSTPREPVWGWGAERLRGAMDNRARIAFVAQLRDALRYASTIPYVRITG